MKRLPYTPRSRIRNALRLLWMRSRERAAALRNTKYSCNRCGVKQTSAKGRKVKLVVHHKNGIDWEGVCNIIQARILQTPEQLEPLCERCHEKEHGNAKKQSTQPPSR